MREIVEQMNINEPEPFCVWPGGFGGTKESRLNPLSGTCGFTVVNSHIPWFIICLY